MTFLLASTSCLLKLPNDSNDNDSDHGDVNNYDNHVDSGVGIDEGGDKYDDNGIGEKNI